MLSEIMCRRIFQQQRQQDEKEAQLREASIRRTHGWSKSCSAPLQGRRTGGGGRPRARNPHRHPQRHHAHRPHRPHRPPAALRPVNVKGNRARGMRAPQNTNQFLMQEKYQMQHLRSDSVGSDSGCSSDSDLELTDMDSYLCVLENARGALLDSPNPHGSTAPGPGPLLVLDRGDGPCVFLQEDSVQYFPSEDDLLQSQNFMQRDFAQFCDFLSP
ncbi:uncharacterized protein wu:fb55g09 [Fundulus heteroclitus]|uniref:uncharacterized protein wu:fb55g09 n=1 Tax=Fundulus heteroclitus TaxID=8078 RepID=UPI00165AD54F|nr:uncharacterized protein wu:fb55g09 [Fundulus heteroclitus]